MEYYMSNFINVEDCFIKTSICWKNERFRKTNEQYPEKYEPKVQEAVSLKKNGRYVEALNIYYDIMYNDEKLYSSILYYMYKVMMCAGRFCCALTTLYYSLEINGTTFKDDFNRTGYTQQTIQFLRLLDCIKTIIETNNGYSLFKLVTSLSGNPNYKYSLSHSEIEAEINSLIELSSIIMDKLNIPKNVDIGLDNLIFLQS